MSRMPQVNNDFSQSLMILEIKGMNAKFATLAKNAKDKDRSRNSFFFCPLLATFANFAFIPVMFEQSHRRAQSAKPPSTASGNIR